MIQMRRNKIEWEAVADRKTAFRKAGVQAFGLSGRIGHLFLHQVLKPLLPLMEAVFHYLECVLCFIYNLFLLVAHTVETAIRAFGGQTQKPFSNQSD